MFQKRHFEAIANEIKTWEKVETKENIIYMMMALFRHYNPNFDREKFIKAVQIYDGELPDLV